MSARIDGAALYRYRLPLVRPLAGLSQREGLLVALFSEGACGLGEAAPWPGLHAVSLDGLRRELSLALPRALLAPLLAAPAGQAPAPPPAPAFAVSASPLAGWALYGAFLELCAARAGEPLARWLSPAAPPRVRAAALVLERQDLESAKLERHLACKVKVRDPTDLSLLATAREHLGDGELRADGNRALSAEGARALLEAARPLRVRFFEEPAHADALTSLLMEGAPVALDESLAEEPLYESQLAQAAALVLKPSVLGPARTRELLSRPAPRIFSSPFESAVGRRLLAALQAALAPSEAPGLGTCRYLSADLAPLEDDSGTLDVMSPLKLDLSNLIEVSRWGRA